ncbi:MAG: alpha-amylase/alpha-mannosidase (GH57 family) [Rhodothermales bacterium]|jgi:alpha-amylase/alpha-mannosidase (GH57 family)
MDLVACDQGLQRYGRAPGEYSRRTCSGQFLTGSDPAITGYRPASGRHLDRGTPIGDEILDALAGQLPEPESWQNLTRSLLRANEGTMKCRFRAYATLHQQALDSLSENRPLSHQNLHDLLVWYVLLWMGESLRNTPMVAKLQTQASGFTDADRRDLLCLLADIVRELLPRYRRLSESGQVELSVTPFSHPILPLLLDMNTGSEAMPGVTLPQAQYPGGKTRCDWQLNNAIRVFREVFGATPAGCWPSEGGLSDATTELLTEHGFRWTASGARVLTNSLKHDEGLANLSSWVIEGQEIDQVDSGHLENTPVTIFFRDDQLSDRIGFEYARWEAEAAVDDFITQIEQRLDAWLGSPQAEESPVLSMIMDGENAWEYFPENGQAFLSTLYRKLVDHPRIKLTTYSELVARLQPRVLPALVAGSWVYGTFSTWVGDAAKNRAWDLLIQAKHAVDAALQPVFEQAAENYQPLPVWAENILQQLSVCEASDWFWWLGDDNQLEDGPAFDSLYRQQLTGLYELLGMVPPDILNQPLNSTVAENRDSAASGEPVSGAMRPASETLA